MTTAVVGSVIGNKPLNGGNAWVVLSWVLGLQRLGLEVDLVEELEPHACVDERGEPAAFDDSINLAYFKAVTQQFGLAGRATLLCGRRHYGRTPEELADVATSTELLVNISGHLTLEPLFCGATRKAYVDLDPGYTQIWHAEGKGARLEGHDAFFTVGTGVGERDFLVPCAGVEWHAVLQPIVLDQWPALPAGERDRFTTVASWRGAFGRAEFDGRTFGQKAHEFRRFVELPRRCPQVFEVAIDIHPGDSHDHELLRHHGWRTLDSHASLPDPHSFRSYVQSSGAEFSVAQGVYVETNSGWFSDRTVRYLASGRPALVQDTAFSRALPVGQGLLTFRTMEEAVAGCRAISDDYEAHARAARQLTEEYFDSDKVLGTVLEQTGVAP